MGSRYHGKANIHRTPEHLEEAYSRLTRWRRRKTVRLSGAQGHRCCYCCTDTFIEFETPKGMSSKQRATLEHLIIQSSDCQTNLDINLVMACSLCNGLRGAKDPMKFYKRLRTKVISTPVIEKTSEKKAKKHLKGMILCMVIMKCWPNIAEEMIKIGEDAGLPKKNGVRAANYIKRIYERIQADSRIPA